MEYCSYQITIFANLPPPSKCRLVRPAPRAPPSLRLWTLNDLERRNGVILRYFSEFV